MESFDLTVKTKKILLLLCNSFFPDRNIPSCRKAKDSKQLQEVPETEKIHQMPPCQTRQRELHRRLRELIRCLEEAEASRAACKIIKTTEATGKSSLQFIELASGCEVCSSFQSTFESCHVGAFDDTAV